LLGEFGGCATLIHPTQRQQKITRRGDKRSASTKNHNDNKKITRRVDKRSASTQRTMTTNKKYLLAIQISRHSKVTGVDEVIWNLC